MEEWRRVPKYNYEVSSYGRVRNRTTQHVLKPMLTGSRSRRAKVRLSSRPRVDRDVAHLVLELFKGYRPVGAVAMHFDDDPTNNHIDNLCWATPQDNAKDMAAKKRGGNQKLSIEDIATIRHRRTAGERGRVLAKEYGVSEQRICDIAKGRTAL